MNFLEFIGFFVASAAASAVAYRYRDHIPRVRIERAPSIGREPTAKYAENKGDEGEMFAGLSGDPMGLDRDCLRDDHIRNAARRAVRQLTDHSLRHLIDKLHKERTNKTYRDINTDLDGLFHIAKTESYRRDELKATLIASGFLRQAMQSSIEASKPDVGNASIREKVTDAQPE